MKISSHERKTRKGGQIGYVRHSHMYMGNVDREVKEGKRSHIVRHSPPWSIRGKGHL